MLSVTEMDYQILYLPVLINVANTQTFKTNICELVFARIITALKLRRAYMLPIGADTETCYQQQDVWTYALFTVVIIKNYLQTDSGSKQEPQNNYAPLRQQIIPAAGLNWLQQYPELFHQWLDYLSSSCNSDNIFAHIIQ